ncbi:HET-domain-containing protein [Stipitochalara longipes BDJ]|nr:HET-domain-containing protein [Stipitochalara longipes BDJ]
MRLIHSTALKLHEFVGSQIPPYAILSHTWGEEEVSFQDLQSNVSEIREKKGFNKIKQCCRIAAEDGFEYAWVDTCCIDKTSSAELSEAINSMFRWYQQAEVCYAFLADVPSDEDPQTLGSAFRRRRWFTRGWTLQELIAPTHVTFLGSDWEDIGSKLSLLELISGITKIQTEALDGSRGLGLWNAAQKMSWASSRVTTREEDTAYCLMGIFDINMPMLYGEGEKAFMRLQEEIIKNSQDESIFAWWNDKIQHNVGQYNRGLLASGPHQFASSGNVWNIRSPDSLDSTQTFTLVCDFIELRFQIILIAGDAKRESFWDQYWHGNEGSSNDEYEPGTLLAMLGCFDDAYSDRRLALCLAWTGEGNNYRRIETDLRHYIATNDTRIDNTGGVCLRKMQMYSKPWYFRNGSLAFWIRVVDSQKRQLNITPIQTYFPLGTTHGSTEGGKLPEGARKQFPILGFRFRWTMDATFLVMIKFVDGKTGDDVIETVEVIDENDSGDLNEILDSFNSWYEHTDRIFRDVPSLGVISVKLKKLGRAWDPTPWAQGGFAYSKIKLFCFHKGSLVEETVTKPTYERLVKRRYLIDVNLK